MKQTLSRDEIQRLTGPLQDVQKTFEARYPGPRGDRQPVHTMYGGAHLFRADTARRVGEKALQSVEEYATDFATFARVIALRGADRLPKTYDSVAAMGKRFAEDPGAATGEERPAWFAYTVYQRVLEKLRREPVEDFRIDFEDGYGNRPDSEEDGHATSVAGEVADG